jgi:hypothetical protein
MSASSTQDECGTPNSGHARIDDSSSPHSTRSVTNWVLAALTAPGAAVVVAAAYIHVLSSAGCSESTCGRMGPGPVPFALIAYGAPVVAVFTIALSFATARHRFGIVLPLIAWILLALGLTVLNISFQTP